MGAFGHQCQRHRPELLHHRVDERAARGRGEVRGAASASTRGPLRRARGPQGRRRLPRLGRLRLRARHGPARGRRLAGTVATTVKDYIDTPSRPRVNWKSVLPAPKSLGVYSREATATMVSSVCSVHEEGAPSKNTSRSSAYFSAVPGSEEI